MKFPLFYIFHTHLPLWSPFFPGSLSSSHTGPCLNFSSMPISFVPLSLLRMPFHIPGMLFPHCFLWPTHTSPLSSYVISIVNPSFPDLPLTKLVIYLMSFSLSFMRTATISILFSVIMPMPTAWHTFSKYQLIVDGLWVLGLS